MAATSTLLRLNKSPVHVLIQRHLLRPSLAAATATKVFDISADSQLPTPNSALSQPPMGAVFQPSWNLPLGMSTLPAMEHSRMEVRGRAVTPDRDEYEDSDGDEDQDGEFGDADLNDSDEDEDEDLSDDADYEDDDNGR